MAFFKPEAGIRISVRISPGARAISRVVSFVGDTKNLSSVTSRLPEAEVSFALAPSAMSAGPRLDGLTKYAGPEPKIAW